MLFKSKLNQVSALPDQQFLHLVLENAILCPIVF